MTLSYLADIEYKYGHVFAGAYEKANLWPQEDTKQKAMMLLQDNTQEVEDALFEMINFYHDYIKDPESHSAFMLDTFEGFTINTILRLLQVIATCEKHRYMFEQKGDKASGGDFFESQSYDL